MMMRLFISYRLSASFTIFLESTDTIIYQTPHMHARRLLFTSLAS
jgi:hypothetical protein